MAALKVGDRVMVYDHNGGKIGKGTVIDTEYQVTLHLIPGYCRVRLDAVPKKPGFTSPLGRVVAGKAAIPAYECGVKKSNLKRLVPKVPSEG
jgi:hypothetical protein